MIDFIDDAVPGGWATVIGALTVGLLAALFYAAVKKGQEWEAFKAAHNCKVVALHQPSSNKKEGEGMNEPAFPQLSVDSDGNLYERGMTLRDYFAAKAMQGAISGMALRKDVNSWRELGTLSYEVADAMLKARSATNTELTQQTISTTITP